MAQAETIRRFRLAWFAQTLLILAMLMQSTAQSAERSMLEGGLYVLQSVRRPLDTSLLDRHYLDGVALQIGWRDVEPSDDSYDWRRIDAVLAAARERHKRVTLHLLPLFPPEWVYKAGAQSLTYRIANPRNPKFGRSMTQAIPWDPVYLAKWADLVRALGQRYARDPTLFAVSVTAPSPEMTLPGAMPGSEAERQWRAVFQREAYLKASRDMVDVYQQAFPSQAKLLAPGLVLGDDSIAVEVLSYAHKRYANKLWVFNAGLNAALRPGPRGMGRIYMLLADYGRKAQLGFQMVWRGSDDPKGRLRGSLREALDNGLNMGASYLEVYAEDTAHPGYTADLTAVAERLRSPR